MVLDIASTVVANTALFHRVVETSFAQAATLAGNSGTTNSSQYTMGNRSKPPSGQSNLAGISRSTPSNLMWHFDNDANTDDLMAFVLLWAGLGSRLTSVTINDGCSHLNAAQIAFQKIFQRFGISSIRLGVGQKTILHPFPNEWKIFSDEIRNLPCLQGLKEPLIQDIPPAVEVLRESTRVGPVRIVATGPLTNIAQWIEECPENVANVHSLVIMGGALNVAGNVAVSDNSDGSAEWNFFADPHAAQAVLSSSIPIVLVPLDVTNDFPVTDEAIAILGNLKSVKGIFAFQLWNLVYRKFRYCLWDGVAALIALDESLAQKEEHRLVVVTDGNAQGRLQKSPDGKACSVVKSVDRERLIEYMAALLKKD